MLNVGQPLSTGVSGGTTVQLSEIGWERDRTVGLLFSQELELLDDA